MGHVLHVLYSTANEDEDKEGLGWSTPLSYPYYGLVERDSQRTL